jgi:hypothetical protein
LVREEKKMKNKIEKEVDCTNNTKLRVIRVNAKQIMSGVAATVKMSMHPIKRD